MAGFDGLGMHLGNLSRVSGAKTRSISGENLRGEKGAGGKAITGTAEVVSRELGQGWKVSPCLDLAGNANVTIADIEGSGAIQHIWITLNPRFWRRVVLRMYWDDEETPSVETPVGDFFAHGWGQHCQINSIPVAVNPMGGFNCYWEMPFRKRARITVENLTPDVLEGFFFQITYTLTDVPEDCAYFHAQWRRSNPVPYLDVHTLLDGVEGQGQFVGTYLAWQANSSGWWGEGEIKFYMDGDVDWPTICGTGTEDYFGGAWAFEHPKGQYGAFSTPYLGMPQVIEPEGFFRNQQRFGLYRWHVQDPIRFESDLRVTIQALGHRSSLDGKPRFMPLQDDIASTVFWYQLEPHAVFPDLGGFDRLEFV
jgi:hypothetical protein